MRNILRSRKGFTLTEAVFSICLLLLIFLAAIDTMIIAKYSASYAKHKIQAMYMAQRTIEALRKQPFASLTGSTITTSIDTRGTPNNSVDDFTGTQVITVSSDLGYHKRVIVEIRWNEIVFGRSKTMHEYCGTFISNEFQVN
jgi:type II secretory pathway pseudopilin PulG